MPDNELMIAQALKELATGQGQLAAALGALGNLRVGQKAPAGTPIVPPWYGQQGLFSYQADDVVINATVHDTGIAGWLDWLPSVNRNREQAIISQASRSTSASRQTGPCTTCPTYIFKGCEMSWCFGRICRETPELQMDEMGMRPSVQYPQRRIYGSIQGGAQGETITRDDEWALVMAGNALRQELCPLIWSGNPANNSALGGYQEFKGLDMLINTGYVDVQTGATCTAADSDVKAYNRQIPCASANTNPWSIYLYMRQLYRTIQYRAQTGLGGGIDPMEMLWVSVPEVIDAIIDCLACTYYPCLAGTGSENLSISADMAANFRDRMYREQVFHIDGVDIPWLKDPCVTHTTGLAFGDETCADLFLLTRRHGPMTLLFGEYQDMNVAPDRTAFGMSAADHLFTTDGGRFLGTMEWLKWCATASLLLKARVVVLAPWLNGRLTNVCVRSPQHYPSPDPSSSYFVDGGHGTPLGKSLYDYCGDTDLSQR